MQLFHNRLTHSLKVAQIGRRIAERLVRSLKTAKHLQAAGWIDPDVVEAACLAHDLGHPPFGHIAEQTLQESLKNFKLDSFEGNAQSFRIVTKLSLRSLEGDQERGLNLSRATLRAILKYPRLYGSENREHSTKKWGAYRSEEADFHSAFEGYEGSRPCAEAVLMDWADDVAFAVHDVEDFFRAGLIPLDQLANSAEARRRFLDYVEQKRSKLDRKESESRLRELADVFFPQAPYAGTLDDRAAIHDFASNMITRYAGAVDLNESGQIETPNEEKAQVALLKELTWFYVIDDPALATLQMGQRAIVAALFERLKKWADSAATEHQQSARLPTHLRNLIALGSADDAAVIAAEGDAGSLRARAVADYIASLTETQAYALHQRLTGGSEAGSAMEAWLRR
jgi:dGTPase